MKLEFAILHIMTQFRPVKGCLYNRRTNEPIQDVIGGDYTDVLQAVSAEGWRIAYVIDNAEQWSENSNSSRWIVWLQREVADD